MERKQEWTNCGSSCTRTTETLEEDSRNFRQKKKKENLDKNTNSINIYYFVYFQEISEDEPGNSGKKIEEDGVADEVYQSIPVEDTIKTSLNYIIFKRNNVDKNIYTD